MSSMFRRAERRKTYVKIAMTGPSGSGKTYSALKLALGLGRRVALLDTENASGSLYADLGEFDTCELGPPFTVEKYRATILGAVDAGYDVLIIDSLTHAWAGEGGLLAQKEALDRQGGNQFTNWAGITKQHETLKNAMLQAPIHVIATMRSKAEYVIDQEGGKKSAPRKVGMAPIQRDGMEYEFMAVFDIAADHSAIASKDRTGLFDGMSARLSEDDGRRIAAWLAGGAEPLPVAAPAPSANGTLPADPERVRVEAELRALLAEYDATPRSLTIEPHTALGKLLGNAQPPYATIPLDRIRSTKPLEDALTVLRVVVAAEQDALQAKTPQEAVA